MNPSSVPRISGILREGYSCLEPWLRKEDEYLDLFVRDLTDLDRDIYYDNLYSAALTSVRLQRGLDQVEESGKLSGTVTG